MVGQKKITVLLQEDEFLRFESYCHTHGFKKSTLIATLIRDRLDREVFQMQRSLPLGPNNDQGRVRLKRSGS